MKNKPEYRDEIAIHNGVKVLCIRDMNIGSMSVTNGVEIVLKELTDKYGTLPEMIIYQDSDGIWDRIIWNGNTAVFAALRERNGAVALSRVTADVPYDIVFVYGPAGCGKTTNAKRIAEYFNLNVIRDACAYAEWPCPLSLRETQRVLYLSNSPEHWVKTDIPRLVKEGYRILLSAYEDLNIPGVTYPEDPQQ